MMFRNCSMMLAFLLKSKTQKEVRRVFDELTEMLGIEIFQTLFPIMLTDNGVEFQDPLLLECTAYSKIRTKIYYCNPNSSWQKGMIEKNQEYIRLIVPKAKTLITSIAKQRTVSMVAHHINCPS